MPRVTRHTKKRAGKSGVTYRCIACQTPIEPGDDYYQWTFRYGGARRQHVQHGMPRQSQLTQSKMSEVYSAQEGLEDWQTPADDAEMPPLDWFEEVRSKASSAIGDAIDAAQGVADEYQEAIDAMPASEEQNQERIDAIEDWISALEEAQNEIDGTEPDDEEDEESIQEAVADIRERLSEAASEFSY